MPGSVFDFASLVFVAPRAASDDDDEDSDSVRLLRSVVVRRYVGDSSVLVPDDANRRRSTSPQPLTTMRLSLTEYASSTWFRLVTSWGRSGTGTSFGFSPLQPQPLRWAICVRRRRRRSMRRQSALRAAAPAKHADDQHRGGLGLSLPPFVTVVEDGNAAIFD
jgi:hypothetical protein